ncbi:MAG: hypothetical protein ABI400_12150 [Lacisediminihabitans sp.]
MRRLLTGLVTVLALGSLLSGCSLIPQFACPTIGWVNSVTVELEGSVEGVHTVELCVEGTCSVSADQLQVEIDEPLQLMTTLPQDPEITAPTSTPATTPPFATKVNDHTWTFNLMMGTAKEVTVRALTADGATITERDVALEWKRVGGSEQCGGPAKTPPIVLSLPA